MKPRVWLAPHSWQGTEQKHPSVPVVIPNVRTVMVMADHEMSHVKILPKGPLTQLYGDAILLLKE